ncbi:coil containing protein [Vibrio phage 1.039.O._10N.286.55.A2]|nr:coil containing protein [Vibrio phage 1.039.O._10N.286.55.A2]AUR83864.1 coil containing protein [Vibrio phage 1.042.O._10N.286.45.B8]AUR84627.1 coil containing protein [Vibrio phage 1.061.O._10N.286.55.C2]AUR85069.1 coil containing protein [Vibrio phage 1.067.O._10N.261.52.C9]
MNKNQIDNAIEDSWKEFERTSEITGGNADNLLGAVEELRSQRDQLAKAFDLIMKPCISTMLWDCEGIDIISLLDKAEIKA